VVRWGAMLRNWIVILIARRRWMASRKSESRGLPIWLFCFGGGEGQKPHLIDVRKWQKRGIFEGL